MKFSDIQTKWLGAAIVALAVAVVFSPVLQGIFLHWDDEALLVGNSRFKGLGLSHWRWMCTTFLLGHWQPLSWLSYALDYTVWEMNPRGWHLTNLLIHALNAVLVYGLSLAFLKKWSGRYTVAVLATLFWAVHPLRVEAVAWLATRGYLLCTTFCLLTILCYLRAAEQKRYPFAALLCFALATFTKGIGMMLPLVLLLIDLNTKCRASVPACLNERDARSTFSFRRAVFEKIPFFALSLLTGITAFLAKKMDGGMAPVELYGPEERFVQALYGVSFYLCKMVSPTSLSPLYEKLPKVGPMMVALVLTTTVTIFLFLFRRKLRPVIVVLTAFLLLVFPMLGFTQSGIQRFADRFTYLSAVPFCFLLVAVLTRAGKLCKPVYGALTALLMIFGVQTFVYSYTWCSNLALWNYAVGVDANNAMACNGKGRALLDCQRYTEALEYFRHGKELAPANVLIRHNHGLTLSLLGRYEEAIGQWDEALSASCISGREKAKILLARGWVFEQIGSFECAENDYGRVADDVSLDSILRAGALRSRSALFVRTGQLKKVEIDLLRILKLSDVMDSDRARALVALDELKKIPRE